MKNRFKRTSMKFMGTMLLLLFCGNMVCAQSTYHYKKGKEYEDIGWWNSAFKEYMKGMQAGEARSAFEVVLYYLYDYGIPRDTNAAKRTLETWAVKDADMCFLATWIYSGLCMNVGKLYVSDHDYSSMIFDRKLYQLGGGWIAPNPQKALKYARMYAKTDGGYLGDYAAKNLAKYLEADYYFKGMAGLPEDKLKAIEIGDETSKYYSNLGSNLREILHGTQKIEDLVPFVKYIEKNTSPFTNVGNYDEENREKFYELYEEWISIHKDNPKQAFADEPAETQYLIRCFAKMRSYKSLYEKYYEYKTQEEINKDIDEIAKNSVFDDEEEMRTVWSKLSVFRLLRQESLTGKAILWSDFESLFSDSRFVESDGVMNKYFHHYDGPQEVSTKISNLEKHQQSRQNLLLERIESHVDELVRYSEERRIRDDKKNNTTLTQNNNGLHFTPVGSEEISLENYKNEWQEITKNIDEALKIYPYSESALQFKREAECAYKYAQTVYAQHNHTETVEMFIELSECDNAKYSLYAETALKSYKLKRESVEQAFLQQQFVKKVKKVYDGFRKIAIKGNLKKLTPDFVSEVKNVVLNPAISDCKKAIAIYPLDTTSKALHYYQGELSLCGLVEKANNNTITNDDIEKHLKQYGTGDYSELFVALRQKATDIANDKYALKRANELTSQSTKEERKTVLNLPMTKECAKEVKKLIKAL